MGAPRPLLVGPTYSRYSRIFQILKLLSKKRVEAKFQTPYRYGGIWARQGHLLEDRITAGTLGSSKSYLFFVKANLKVFFEQDVLKQHFKLRIGTVGLGGAKAAS